MSFLEHLEELRWTLVKCAIALAVAVVVCMCTCHWIARALEWPIRRMHFLEHERSTVTLMVGETALGPYNVDMQQLAASTPAPSAVQPEGAAPSPSPTPARHMVFRLQMEGAGENAVASFKLDPAASSPASPVRLRNFNPAEGFMVAFDLSLHAALVLSSPFLLYFLGSYLLPALKPRERRIFYTWLGWGIVLFFAGVAFTYFYLLPIALAASVEYSNMLGFEATDWRAGEYFSFAEKFMLGMGLGFQLPIVTLTLVRIGVLSYSTLSRYRRHVIVVSFVLGAVLTTPEPITQVAMAVPLCLLYEACIWIAWYWERKERRLRKAASNGEVVVVDTPES